MGARYTLDAKELFDLTGKAAIVTGAAQGIGRAVAEGLASAGVFVVMADVLDSLRETEQAIVDRQLRRRDHRRGFPGLSPRRLGTNAQHQPDIHLSTLATRGEGYDFASLRSHN